MRYEGKIATMAFAMVLVSASAALALPVIGTGSGAIGSAEPRWEVDLGFRPPAPFIVNPASPFWVDPVSAGVTAKWITPYLPGGPLANPGFNCVNFCPQDDPNATTSNMTYTYSLVFDDPNSDLHITWASDNSAEFFLNDKLLATLGSTGFSSLSAFTILNTAETFSDGVNTFKVVVTNIAQNNAGNPTGLLVNIHTPLPPALLLFGSGLAGLGWLSLGRGRRQRRGQAEPPSA